MIYLILSLIGLAVGAIINVLADDLPERHLPSLPHCHDDACAHRYNPAGWLAILRWPIYRGRCPNCQTSERYRPIITELVTATTLGVLPFFFTDLTELMINAFYLCILILIIVIDIEHRLILHVVTVPSTLIAILALSWLLPDNNMRLAAVGALTGFLFFYILYWLGNRFYGAGALGFGDVTLSMTMGAMLGFQFILPTLIMGILIGGIMSAVLLLTRIANRSSYIPYGPFLAIAGMIMILWGQPLMDWYFG